MFKLENNKIAIEIKLHGAELCSLRGKASGTEYLWNADPKYWGRTSPVLFPFVGGVKDGRFRYEGQEYPMNQHGFARDMDFTLLSEEDREVWFALDSTDATYSKYPFYFRLEIGYQLLDSGVKVMWRVKNTGAKELYFSIGAHPAFFCPINKQEQQKNYFIKFEKSKGSAVSGFENTVFGQNGLVTSLKKGYHLNEGCLPVSEHLFDGDALVLENHQVQRISLLDPQKKEYLAVEFDAPLAGVWSPPKKTAPFICIEPWYGRCDSEEFDGELKDRKWGNTLEPEGVFAADYKIMTME